MNKSALLLATILAVTPLHLTAGCAGKKKSPKPDAVARWRTARAATLAALAHDQLKAGQLAESRKTCESALAVDPTLPGIHLLAARIAVEQDRLTDAWRSLQVCEALEPAPPTAADMHHLAGTIAGRWQQPDEAERRHALAASLAPDVADYLVAWVESLVDADRTSDAADILTAAVTRFQGNAAVFDAYGQVLLVLDRFPQAAEAFRRAGVYAPDDAEIRERYALAMLLSGDGAGATRVYRRLVAADATRADLFVGLGEARLLVNDAAGAEDAFRAATRCDRHSFAAWAGLTKAQLGAGNDAAAAMSVERAVALAESDVKDDARLLRGLIHVRRGDFRLAAADLHGPAGRGDPLAMELYALCLAGLGDHASARHVATSARLIAETGLGVIE